MDEKKLNLDILLKEINSLKNDYSKQEEFNAFHILRLNDKEVMHSRFIKSLLNPNEIHGYKDDFLKLFLKRVDIVDFNTNGITVECEKNTHNNRFIDIAIENKVSRQMIIIENKIWAGDLKNQLLDYYEYGLKLYENRLENIYMVYLTPYGKRYGNNSFPIENKQPKNAIKCISYEKDILEWLNDCLIHIGNKANRIYMCIEMYIELIRKTINRNKYMVEILKHLVSNPSQMEAAIDIVKALQGRNILEFNSDTRNLIIKNITKSFEILGIETNPYSQEDGIYYFDEIHGDESFDIIIEKDCIYGEKANRKTNKIELEISGNDLNNKYLVALLINDTDLTQEWINKTINYLIDEAENR